MLDYVYCGFLGDMLHDGCMEGCVLMGGVIADSVYHVAYARHVMFFMWK